MNIKKFLLASLGGAIIGVGVGIILYANIGSDTVTVFQDGLHVFLNVSYGQASRIYNFSLIVLVLIFARKYFGIGTLISAIIVGYLIDITYDLMALTGINTSFYIALIIFLVGMVIYTLGLALLIRCELGMNCLDSLLYKLIDLTHFQYSYIRIFVDILLTLVGYLLGGVFGIGTIISVVITGPLVEFFSKKKETV